MASLNDIENLVKEIKDNISSLLAKQQINANQVKVVTGLSDITERLGLIQAGEFRTGNGSEPGEGFTGGRFGYPGFTYDGTEYFLVGVDNDEMQVGLSLANGTLVAGAGNVRFNSDGFVLYNNGGTIWFKDKDTDGTKGGIFGNYLDDLSMVNYVAGRSIRFYVTTSGGTSPSLSLREDPENADVFQIDYQVGANGTKITIGSEVQIWAHDDGRTTVFNAAQYNIDFQVYGMADENVIYMDASNNNLGVGTAVPNVAAKLEVNSTTKGFLPPRMTTAQRDAISSPPAGLVVFNTSTNKLNVRGGAAWEAVTSA